ncbi:MAG: hypothetical protein ACRDA8_06980 [Shewanella sp.]
MIQPCLLAMHNKLANAGNEQHVFPFGGIDCNANTEQWASALLPEQKS